jgi:hypothetical protein
VSAVTPPVLILLTVSGTASHREIHLDGLVCITAAGGGSLISTIHENVDAGGELDELRDRSNHGDQRIAFRFSKNTL